MILQAINAIQLQRYRWFKLIFRNDGMAKIRHSKDKNDEKIKPHTNNNKKFKKRKSGKNAVKIQFKSVKIAIQAYSTDSMIQ